MTRLLLADMFTGKTFVSIDLETTGLRPQSDRIIEIGAVKYRDGEVVDTYETLINPGIKLTNLSEAITGIKNSDLADAPKMKDVLIEAKAFIGDAAIIGHNVQFDIDFLKENGIDLSDHEVFDTYQLASTILLDMPSYSLSSLTAELGIKQPVSHRALHDAISSLDLFRHILTVAQSIPADTMTEILSVLDRTTWSGGDLLREAAAHPLLERIPRVVDTDSRNVTTQGTWKWHPDAVISVFEKNGLLSEIVAGFEPRDAQIEMVKQTVTTLSEKHRIVVEASTGTGKTLAYLIPMALRAMSTGTPGMIATYTIALQDQIREKDIPVVQEVVQRLTSESVQVTFLKGRSHYFCKNRFDILRARAKIQPAEARLVIRILLWLATHNEHEILEQTALPREHGNPYIWDLVASDSDFCRGAQCTEESGCMIQKIRRQARSAQLVITNHALLIADAAQENAILPDYTAVVVDEAHHLEDVATSQWTGIVQSTQWDSQLRDIRGVVELFADRSDMNEQVTRAKEALDELKTRGPIFFGLLGVLTTHLNEKADAMYMVQSLITPDAREHWHWHKVYQSGEVILGFLGDVLDCFDTFTADDPENMQVFMTQKNIQRTLHVIEQLLVPNDDIVWTTTTGNDAVSISVAPHRVDTLLTKSVFRADRSVILTSATLTVNSEFSYFQKAHGIDDSWGMHQLPPVFDYKQNARIFSPEAFPNPQSSTYPAAVADTIEELVTAIGGRTLVLTTSYREVERLYAHLTIALKDSGIAVLAQNLSGRGERLLKSFKEAEKPVLIATTSFWEGIDVPGKQLHCVIIPKLPFEVPSNPIYSARSRMYDNPFMDYAVPRAVTVFRQGFGRLIRTSHDRGALVLLDTRVIEKEYGKRFIASLPPIDTETVERKSFAKAVQTFLLE